jgi:uncharacterized membrane protein YraQ (UPF0718 family)
VIIPKELIIKWVGAKSGLRGIIIATLIGVITPGGAMLSFPLGGGLFFKIGAGYGPVVAYITSWELLSLYVPPSGTSLLWAGVYRFKVFGVMAASNFSGNARPESFRFFEETSNKSKG